MAQDSKRFGDAELPFVFIPDDADAPAVMPSSNPLRLRAQLVPSDGPSRQSGTADDRHPPARGNKDDST